MSIEMLLACLRAPIDFENISLIEVQKLNCQAKQAAEEIICNRKMLQQLYKGLEEKRDTLLSEISIIEEELHNINVTLDRYDLSQE